MHHEHTKAHAYIHTMHHAHTNHMSLANNVNKRRFSHSERCECRKMHNKEHIPRPMWSKSLPLRYQNILGTRKLEILDRRLKISSHCVRINRPSGLCAHVM